MSYIVTGIDVHKRMLVVVVADAAAQELAFECRLCGAFRDSQRLVRRFIAGELILSFVPNAEQREMRTVTRRRVQLSRDKVRLQSQMECLLEECRIKLSSVISDLLGASGKRILAAIAAGESDPAKLAALGDDRLKCTREQLQDAVTCVPGPR